MCTVPAVPTPRLRLHIATALEDGRLRDAPALGPALRAIARGIAPFVARRLERRLVAPPHLRVVTVGGTTLGGSGKTRLALAVTEELARLGRRVALVGHAYRAAPSCARRVDVDDALAEVGDEALACARRLAGSANAEVIVAPRRGDAVTLAAERGADVVVLDGPIRTRPTVPDLALLAVDPRAPWGAGALLPAGDLLAPPESLLAAADLVVPVEAAPRDVVVDGEHLALATLASRADGIGLFTAVARPDRLLRALGRAGIVPAHVVRAPDHGPLDRSLLAELRAAVGTCNLSVWLASPKCAEHLRRLGEAEVPSLAVMVDAFTLPSAVRAQLVTRFGAVHERTAVP